jgi:hypothetical protein
MGNHRIQDKLEIGEQRQSCGKRDRCSTAERLELGQASSYVCIPAAELSLPVERGSTRLAGTVADFGEERSSQTEVHRG